ncbi:hypothetical protein [Pimelobacter simplex]
MDTANTRPETLEPVLALAEIAGRMHVSVQTFFMIGRMTDGDYQLPVIVR